MSKPDAPADPSAQPRAIDVAALGRLCRRLSVSGTAPWLHQEIARRMSDKLEVIRMQPQAVVQWWPLDVDGSPELTARYPKARQVLVAPSLPGGGAQAAWATNRARDAGWLQRWMRLGRAGRRSALVQRCLDDDPLQAGSAQMLWSNLALHATPDMSATLSRWHAALEVDGFVMFSLLGPDTLRELRMAYAGRGWGEPTQVFRDMHDVGDMLVGAGFADPVMDMEHLRLTWPDAERLLEDLRSIGVNLHPSRFPALRTPRWRNKLLALLDEALRGSDGRLALTFEVIYGHAVKPKPRMRIAPEAVIGLDDMRAMVGLRRVNKPDTDA